MSNLFKTSPMFDSIEIIRGAQRLDALEPLTKQLKGIAPGPRLIVSHDGGDIDNNGHWYLNGVCCLGCGGESRARLEIATPGRYYYVVLACAECGEPLSPVFDQFDGWRIL